MNRGIVLGDWITDSIVTQIYTGLLPCGTNMPTVDKLCETYCVGRNTMRRVLLRLEEGGYITQSRGKPAKVIFDFNSAARRESHIMDLLKRREAVLDVYNVLGLLMPDVAAYCLDLCGEKEIALLKSKMQTLYAQLPQKLEALPTLQMSIYRDAISKAGNPLLTQMLIDMLRYAQPPFSSVKQNHENYSVSIAQSKQMISLLMNAVSTGDGELLKSAVRQFCVTTAGQSKRFFDRLAGTVEKVPAASSQFYWSIDQRREYRYAKVAVDLLKSISSGQYGPGDLLPSYAELSETYHIAGKTAEKAIAVLSDFQIVCTQNGVGTRVLHKSERNYEQFSKDPAMLHNLSTYLMCLQIVMLTSNEIVMEGMKYIDNRQIADLTQSMYSGRCVSVQPLFDFFYRAIPSPCLQRIYSQLQDGMVWGCCLELFGKEPGEAQYRMTQQARTAVETLKSRDARRTAESMLEMYRFIMSATLKSLPPLPQAVPIPVIPK